MFLRLIAIILSVWSFGCATTKDAGRIYFNQGSKLEGVEPADELLQRMKRDQRLREITHGRSKAFQIVRCTLLRNQLYAAAASKVRDEEMMAAVKMMERAYQADDESFLSACDQIMASDLGKKFLAIQQEYLGNKK